MPTRSKNYIFLKKKKTTFFVGLKETVLIQRTKIYTPLTLYGTHSKNYKWPFLLLNWNKVYWFKDINNHDYFRDMDIMWQFSIDNEYFKFSYYYKIFLGRNTTISD